jgi:beta-N-acetylhexosaminidase
MISFMLIQLFGGRSDKKTMACFVRFIIVALLLGFPYTLTSASAIEPGLDTRIGQMIMIGFRGLDVTDDSAVVQDIVNSHIGGVILFDYDVPSATFIRNIDTEKQLKNLISSLQSRASIPLFVAIDQEGGKVNRLKEVYGFPPTLSQQRLGTIDDLKKTTTEAENTAALLARTGINLNLAPVIDLNSNPQNPIIGKVERSFGADPIVVTRHALAVIDAHHRYGILTALKHFPGQGSANGDTQKGFVDVTKLWSPVELEPFRNLIKKGKADLVMTAHIFNRELDPAWPATLSSKTINDLLRRDMEFDGVVISDDLQMKSITGQYTLDTAITQSILAGADILILANNSVYEEDVARRAVSAIKRSIQRGYLTENRINESWQRIKKLKDRLEKQPRNEPPE